MVVVVVEKISGWKLKYLRKVAGSEGNVSEQSCTEQEKKSE